MKLEYAQFINRTSCGSLKKEGAVRHPQGSVPRVGLLTTLMVASAELFEEATVAGASVTAGAEVAWGVDAAAAGGGWLAEVPQAARIIMSGRHKLNIQNG
jgi:hypothetical protein